jgi:hypothetical protein
LAGHSCFCDLILKPDRFDAWADAIGRARTPQTPLCKTAQMCVNIGQKSRTHPARLRSS